MMGNKFGWNHTTSEKDQNTNQCKVVDIAYYKKTLQNQMKLPL